MERHRIEDFETEESTTVVTDDVTLCELKGIMCPNQCYWGCVVNIQYLQLFFKRGNIAEEGIAELRVTQCSFTDISL